MARTPSTTRRIKRYGILVVCTRFFNSNGPVIAYQCTPVPSRINVLPIMQMYGESVTPEAILSGQVPWPSEFAPLYEMLDKLSAAASEELDDPLVN